MADLTDYTGLITSEHNQRPKFMAVVEALTKPMVALQNLLGGMPDVFDLDKAVGVQLDAVGLWVGIARRVATPLTGVYFSLDTAGVGFDQGNWKGPFDPDTGLTLLDDDTYRLVLRAKIGANHWDGTLGSTAAILNSIFSPGDGPVAVHADAEPFGAGDSATTQFQLLYHGQPVYQVDSATLYRNDWQGNQLMYPTARTNTTTYSEQLNNAAWNAGSQISVTANAAVSPDGNASADLLIPSTVNGQHYYRNGAMSVFPAGAKVGGSVWVKPSGYTKLQLTFDGAAAWQGGIQPQVRYDLTTGAITTQSSSVVASLIESYPDGWYRIGLVAQNGSAGPVSTRLAIWIADNTGNYSFAGNGASGVLCFGVQTEQDVIGSYIPTTSAAGTVTDYTLGPSGIAQLAVPPAPGAALTWTGDGEIYPSGTYVFIQDNQDMSMTIGVAGEVPSAVFLALLEGGYIPLKPEGVRVNYVIVTSVDGVPMFGFDVANQYVMGLDAGAWGTPL